MDLSSPPTLTVNDCPRPRSPTLPTWGVLEWAIIWMCFKSRMERTRHEKRNTRDSIVEASTSQRVSCRGALHGDGNSPLSQRFSLPEAHSGPAPNKQRCARCKEEND